MPDRYPSDTSIPREWLVPPALQPDFPEVPGLVIDPFANVGRAIADLNASAGLGDATALVHAESGRSYTFGELARTSEGLAVGLRAAGIMPGDRIAFRSRNVPEAVLIALATWKAGAVVVPTPAQARSKELRFFLDDTRARMLFVSGGADLFEDVPAGIEGTQVERVVAFGDAQPLPQDVSLWTELMGPDGEVVPEVPVDSVAVVWHTGGTTGTPKAIYHTHRRILAAAHGHAAATGAGPGEIWAAAAPVGHALGFALSTMFTLLHGATVVLIEDFASAEAVVRAINAHRVSTFTAITVTWARMHEALKARPDIDVPSLAHGYAMWQSASSTSVYEAWLDRGIELRNNFGSTAFASWVLVPPRGEPVPRASLGRAVPGYEVTALALPGDRIEPVGVGQPGRLAVRGASGLTYWNRPELQRRDVRDGWTLVDDVISFDEHGNAFYLGRTDYIISSAGNKITPGEVEEALGSHPAVREVGVVGAPDAERQEIVVAFIVLEDGHPSTPELAAELQNHAKTQIAPYKYPRRIHFVDALPRDPVGKLQQRVLQSWASQPVEGKAGP